MENCKVVETPLFQGLDLATDKSERLTHGTSYRQLIGSLLYYVSTVRPAIAFAVGYISRFMHNPTAVLWKAAKHISRYLSGTKKPGIVYDRTKNEPVQGFSNADWGS